MKRVILGFLIVAAVAYGGAGWVGLPSAGGGVDTVDTFSASAQTNGATISGDTITFGPASATVPGMVSTGTQVFAGNKQFTGSLVQIGTASAAALASPYAPSTIGVIQASNGGGSQFPFLWENTAGGSGPSFIWLNTGTSSNVYHSAESMNSSGAYKEITYWGGEFSSNTAGAEVGDFTVKVASSGGRPQGETPALRLRGLDKTLQLRGGVQFNNDTGGTSVPKPTCNSTHRGTLWYTPGGSGVADTVEICLKDAANAYAWTAK